MDWRTLTLIVAVLLPGIAVLPSAPPPSTGTIRGTVLDENGQPVPGAHVTAGTYRYPDRKGFIRLGPPTQVDARGVYELQVPAGEWIVSAHINPFRLGGRVDRRGPEYRETYFPGVTDLADATFVTVDADAIVAKVSLTLVRRTFHSLRIPVDLAGLDVASIQMTLMSADGQSARTLKAQAIQDDLVTIDRVPPGNYLFWMTGLAPSGVMAGSRAITLSSDTIESPLLLHPAASVSGIVRVEGTNDEPPSGLRVSTPLLDEHDRPVSYPIDSDDVDETGRFHVQGLFGRRTLRVHGLVAPWTIRRLVIEGRDIPPGAVLALADSQALNAVVILGRER